MKTMNWKRTLWISVAVLLLVVAAVFVVWYQSTNYLLRSIAGMGDLDTVTVQEEQLADPPIASSNPDLAEKAETTDTASDNASAKIGDATPVNSSDPSSAQTNVGESQTGTAQPASDDAGKTVQGENKQTVAPESGNKGYDPNISTKKATEVQESITLAEKARVTGTMVRNLDTQELKQLAGLASGGLSLEEKKEAKKIILEKLSEEEYNELIAIAAKYGLSEGKKYDETSRPE